MARFRPQDMLWIWEQGQSSSPTRRALLIWMAASGERDWKLLADQPLGRREAALLRIRAATFGSTMEFFVVCPGCDAELEMQTDVHEELERGEPDDIDARFELEIDTFQLEARLPTSTDLLALEQTGEVERARRHLFSRCVEHATRRGDPIDIESVPDEVVDRVSEEFEHRDPLADMSHSLTCPMCQHSWRARLDTAEFVWREIEVWARRLLREVDTLASAYGWSEGEILDLSAFRRRCYLELLRS